MAPPLRLRLRSTALVAVLLLVLCPATAHAHSGSYDLKFVDGSNVVLLTLNSHEPVTGTPILHNIRLYDLVGNPVPYTEVLVEVRRTDGEDVPGQRGRPVLHDEVLPISPDNDSTLRYRYPQPGNHALALVFMNGEQEVSRAEFSLPVAAGPGSAPLAGFATWQVLVAFVLGVACALLLGRRAASAGPDAERPEDRRLSGASA